MTNFGWHYPPGCNPNDPHIVGYPPVVCPECNCEVEHTDECENCGKPLPSDDDLREEAEERLAEQRQEEREMPDDRWREF